MSTKEILKSTHQGELNLNGFKISCAVLEDGTRVLVNRSLANAFGIKGSGAYWQKKKGDKGANLPEYLSANYLEPFIDKEALSGIYESIPYINKQGILTEGVRADFLPDICDIFVKAGEKGALKNGTEISNKAYGIILAFSKVGITALVDEVTGYQDVRVKDAIQQILNKFLLEEAKKYQVTFPLELYKQWFRLNGWDWKPENAQKRPGVIGTWTNKYIYERMAPELLVNLKSKNPKNDKGQREFKMFQFLTEDIGEPRLREFFGGLIALARASTSWRKYVEMVERAYPTFGDQTRLQFPDED